MKNVLLIKGNSQYNAQRNYIEEIEIGFRLSGYNTVVLDVNERALSAKADALAETVKIDLVFTCNAQMIGCIMKKFPDAVFVTYLTDHPIFVSKRLVQLNGKAVVFVCDRFHLQYINEYFPNIKHCKFIPLSGSYSQKDSSFQAREVGVIFTGTYKKPERLYADILSSFDGMEEELAKFICFNMIEDYCYDFENYLERALKHIGMNIDKEEFAKLMEKFCGVFSYGGFWFRDRVIRVLIENGIKIHVFGNGWEDFESEYKDNLIIEKGNYYVAQKEVAKARISLNIMPWFRSGFQERIATAMLSGTVSVTDESYYIIENFRDGEELITYSLGNLEELPRKILFLLENENDAARIAKVGKERAENELTWQHRTFEMINFINSFVCTGFQIEPGTFGKVLPIHVKRENSLLLGLDAIDKVNEILELLVEIQRYDKVDLCDIEYLYNKYLYLYLELKVNFSDVKFSETVYTSLKHLREEDLQSGIELLVMECKCLQYVFLEKDNDYLRYQCEELKKQQDLCLEWMKKKNEVLIPYNEQKILIEKIVRNYRDSKEEEMREILNNIRRTHMVDAYNQNFAYKYIDGAKKRLQEIYYDEESEMHYVLLKGKRMYYPKSHPKEYIASESNFVNLEQDEESPHRYLEGGFQVQEGDIVIDAGVAEGNFALEVVEKAQKVYLVECEHEWIQALEKTFEPWKEKVIIIEKMLASTDDDFHICIDSFVQEGQVNFIKLDVEGAELESLKGASMVLKNSNNIRCAICAYHRKNAEYEIRKLLERYGFYTTTSKGYIFYKEDLDSWVDGELRRGIVRAEKI